MLGFNQVRVGAVGLWEVPRCPYKGMWALWPTTTLTIPGRGDDVKTLSPSQASDGLEQPGKLPKRHAQASAVPGDKAALDEIDAVVHGRRCRAKDGPDSPQH